MANSTSRYCQTFDDWRLGCQDEVDQALPNARKNTRASRNSATKPNAVSSAKTNRRARQAIRANWIWTNCKGTPPSKPHCFKWVPTTAIFPACPANAALRRLNRSGSVLEKPESYLKSWARL